MTQNDHFLNEVLAGLRSHPKKVSPKYFYDERGSELFEKICEAPEYYPTRTETRILEKSMHEISSALGSHCVLYEFGSGASTKTKILLDAMEQPEAYLPIDISESFLLNSADKLRELYPRLKIVPICADFTLPLPREKISLGLAKKAGFLPGSTLGNFSPEEANHFLSSVSTLLGKNGLLLVGIDLVKDIHVLEAAYNDSQGYTALFNLNFLHRLRNELSAKLKVSDFQHLAFYNSKMNRIEMHLVSKTEQTIEIAGQAIHFARGESIHTENSYKYTPHSFEELAAGSGFETLNMWTDEQGYFGVFLLRVNSILQVSPHREEIAS
jgi:dimethylhistidine N-methyltransferase